MENENEFVCFRNSFNVNLKSKILCVGIHCILGLFCYV